MLPKLPFPDSSQGLNLDRCSESDYLAVQESLHQAMLTKTPALGHSAVAGEGLSAGL